MVPGLTRDWSRRRRHAGRRRGLRGRAVVPGHGGRVRQGARAVRPEDRRLPGDQAPVRRDARDHRVGDRGRVGRRVRRRRQSDDEQWRSPPTSPRSTASTARSRSPRTASRCSAASASPSSTTRTSTCAGRSPCAALVGDGDAAAARLAGARRRRRTPRRCTSTSTGATTPSAPRCGPTAERIAGLPDEERRAALAEAGYLTPHWPAPHGLGADPVTSWSSTRSSPRPG